MTNFYGQYIGFGSSGAGGAVFTEATGGTITTDGDYKVHTFNSSGTFEVTTLGADDETVQYLVVAGGASGGATKVEVEVEQVDIELLQVSLLLSQVILLQ